MCMETQSYWWVQTFNNNLTLYFPFQAKGEKQRKAFKMVTLMCRIPYFDDRRENMQKSSGDGAECDGHTLPLAKVICTSGSQNLRALSHFLF